jgi:hypothetical protein
VYTVVDIFCFFVAVVVVVVVAAGNVVALWLQF